MQKDFLIKSLDIPLGQTRDHYDPRIFSEQLILSRLRKHSTLFKNSQINFLIKLIKRKRIKYSGNEIDEKIVQMRRDS